MLTLTFPPSKSKNYSLAQQIVGEFKNFTLAYGANLNQVIIKDTEISENLPKLNKLIGVIQKLSGNKLEFNGKRYEPYSFIRDQQFMKECSESHLSIESHCFSDDIHEGWGCKFIKSMFRHLKGDHFYKGNKYWYNYGSFKDDNTWIVDKKAIEQIIFRECEEKNLISCPHFNADLIRKNINGLPAKLPLNGSYWERLYRKDVLPDGTINNVPVNIRHVNFGEHITTDNKAMVAIDFELPYDLRRRNRNLPLS